MSLKIDPSRVHAWKNKGLVLSARSLIISIESMIKSFNIAESRLQEMPPNTKSPSWSVLLSGGAAACSCMCIPSC